MDKKLLKDLLIVRDKLKSYYNNGGKVPTVCSDEALYELARLAPKRKEDMLNISGLGQTFVDKYGNAFFEVLKAYHEKKNINVLPDNEVRQTLQKLEKRLVNISKRNRLLYLPKLNSKNGIDLFFDDNDNANAKALNFLTFKTKQLSLCNIKPTEELLEENEKRYKKLNTLFREVIKDFRETGDYELYVAYPFVIGKTLNEDFNVRAPLALFPVEFFKDAESISIKLDINKDILLNTNLILLHNKINNINTDLPANTLDEFDKAKFINEIQSYYKNCGIEINTDENSNPFNKFKEYTVDTFPKFKSGEFAIDFSAVIGKFSLFASSLQKDFKNIVKSENISQIVNNLLTGVENIDVENIEKILENKKDETNYEEFFEKNLCYINQLNTSQENAILKSYNYKELVVQGPPGTGKSQTITSLITDCVNKGRNVLMVSQKKAALDVIYSRLGNLSKYAIYLSDTKNKNTFYSQLSVLFALQAQNHNTELYQSLSEYIDTDLQKLQNIYNKLTVKDEFGSSILNIYEDNINNEFVNLSNVDTNSYISSVDKDLVNLSYKSIKLVHKNFTEELFLDNALVNLNIRKSFPFIENIKTNLNSFEKVQMKKDFDNFIDSQNVFLKQNIFKRMFNSNKQKAQLKNLLNKYFINKKDFKNLYKNYCILTDALNNYDLFLSTNDVYKSLNKNEIAYLNSLNNLKNCLKLSNKETNDKLFNFIVVCMIDNFETENSDILNNISNFSLIVKQVVTLQQQKREVSIEKTSEILSTFFKDYIVYSKRGSEIQRITEGKRKWSINKFINRFSFELFKGIRIWLLTPETVAELLPLDNSMFDLLVFDEASQIYIENSVSALSRAKSVVIAGDQKQLRPSSLGFGKIELVNDETNEDEYENAALEEESLLDLARYKFPEVLLNYHYRSKFSELINFSNYAFYKGRLNISPNTEKPSQPPIKVIKIDNGLWEDRTNKNEAIKVVELVKNILETRKNKDTIGIITFNSNQRDLILDLFDEECKNNEAFNNLYNKEIERKENGEDVGLFVKNIENVQGDERDIIIFSLSYAKNKQGKIVRNFGWLNQLGGENRLNVAITRAKKQIYIISSITSGELITDDLKNEGPLLFKKYIEYATYISNEDIEGAERILSSFNKDNFDEEKLQFSRMENEIYTELLNRNVKIVKNVGLGNYKLDLAIKNKANNKFILGLEFDGKLYKNNINTRERDLHRQIYLETRGWKVYRVFSSNYYHNKEKEINNIIELINKIDK